ncbi:LIC11966 family surface protein [Sphingobacterium psychroaquaticum]|uniref:Uncharacterized protein n=1 Tax=Sphingobacterium psychroaquaticum TaxID=561061 RepID=A0A1X7KPB7_9SPHI|nr:hypothetical protein [Sphingobacterium psychroaquaticum]QBQ40540.1 hypothetical protein E2P86_04990 [Sphingobacterium psychroaquaticum]SMG43352.1 hypothetical protein SAMN05660862_3085 [Sphingobacterium psychroaquaticum]
MKKLLIKGITLMVLLTVMSCGASKDPVEYNNAVITVINGSGAYIGKMNAAMESKNYDEAEKVRVDWAKAVDADIKKMEEIGDFNGDAGLQNAVLKGLKGYKKIVDQDYPKLIDIRKNNKEDVRVEQTALENINKAFENMANGVNEASNNFEKTYKK